MEYKSVRRTGIESAVGAGLIIAAALLAIAWLIFTSRSILVFDDSYMFYRYALNIRHGFGIAWNPSGAPTYGLTSQLWVWFVLPLTYTTLGAGTPLRAASWFIGVLGIVLIGLTVARHAESRLFKFRPAAIFVAAILLLTTPIFPFHMTTGMDTMLSFLANASLLYVLLDYKANPTKRQAYLVGFVGFVAILARPENGLCAIVVPILVWVGSQRRAVDHVLAMMATTILLFGIELIVCQWYFGVPLPLGFYVKSQQGYAGFENTSNAVEYFYIGSQASIYFAALLFGTVNRLKIDFIVALLLPVAATFIYLMTVRQIMGINGRFYIPFLPYLIIASLISVDSRVLVDLRRALIGIVVAIPLAILIYHASDPLWSQAEAAYLEIVLRPAIPEPKIAVDASARLPPLGWFDAIQHIGDDIVATIPRNAVIAASEVGYLGYIAPQISIIDLAGLNDTRIGLHGLSMDDLLARKPDLIWMPHTGYSGLRQAMLSDRRFFERYLVIKDAFNYGLAIRRDSLMRDQIEASVRSTWAELYPGYEIDNYIVKDIPVERPHD